MGFRGHAVIKYRPDIDGLRAIAVLAVFAFHLHYNLIPGGFVGVDVFFVISGYLITKVLIKDLERGSFSIAGFYERRVRRIVPAFVAVLACVFVLAYFYLLPEDFETFARSAVMAALSCSNFFFATQTGYFQSEGPLLHTWSLGVEEQFYIVFPLLLALLWRSRKWRSAGILLLAFVSLAVSIAIQRSHPAANFYMPYTRAWELLSGALLPLGLVPRLRSRVLAEVASLGGVLLIAGSMMKYSEATVFPGLAAVAPCVGAVLVIYAGETFSPVVNRALSLPPLVFVGLISYSLYLWHWPLIVFYDEGFLRVNSLSHRYNVAILLVSSLVLSFLTWRFIEIPFRVRKNSTRKRLFVEAACALGLLVAIGVSVVRLDGLAYRFPAAALEIAKQAGARESASLFRPGHCFVNGAEPIERYSVSECLKVESTKPNYLLLGDSHAAVLWRALALEFKDANILQATSSNCKPFPASGEKSVCAELMNYVYGDFLPRTHVDGLIVTARWKVRDIPKLDSLVAWCREQHIPIVVIGPAEEYDAPLPTLLAFSIRSGDSSLPFHHRITDIETLDREMQAEARRDWHVPYVSLIGIVCKDAGCREYADAEHRTPMLFDHDHYSEAGAEFVVASAASSGQLRLQ